MSSGELFRRRVGLLLFAIVNVVRGPRDWLRRGAKTLSRVRGGVPVTDLAAAIEPPGEKRQEQGGTGQRQQQQVRRKVRQGP